MPKMNIKKGDKVRVIAGKDKGAEGEVIAVNPKARRVTVENVNLATKAMHPTQTNQQGGLMKMAAPLDASNVMLVCPSCSKPTRIGHEGTGRDKKRVCKKCGATIE